jgi:NADPH-dependent 2,4-dienoyl-CoA reductase/sulfur reductase-like enzyme
VQQAAAGGNIAAVLLSERRANWLRALPHLPGFLASGLWRQGLRLKRQFEALGLPVVKDVAAVECLGKERVTGVRYRTGGGAQGEIPADLVGLHEGVIPNANLARALGCEHLWDAGQQAFRPKLDAWFNSSLEGLQIVGDGGGIAGADACVPAGRLAALGAAAALGRISGDERDDRAMRLRRQLNRLLAGRAFVERLFAPRLAASSLADEVTICRCEEVSAGDLRQALATGAEGPNQVKAFLRCGMGPCQGRFCGPTVTRLIAEARGVGPETVGYFRLRPPIKPIPLRSFAEASEERQ